MVVSLRVPRRLLIISGPMRSGTTLLGNMLHGGGANYRHPELALAPDTVTEFRDLSTEVANSVDQRLPLMNGRCSTEFLEAYGAAAEAVFPRFIDSVARTAEAPNTTMVGVKLTCLLPELMALAAHDGFDARFVIMKRAMADTLASQLKRLGPGRGSEVAAFMNASFSSDYDATVVPKALYVRYEDLVSQPRREMTRVLVHAGLDPEKYLWDRIENDLMSNSSFAGIGPNDSIAHQGLVPSIGRGGDLSVFHTRLVRLLSARRSPTWFDLRARAFLDRVAVFGQKNGYAMASLRSLRT